MIYAVIIFLSILGMVWVGRICYKNGREDEKRNQDWRERREYSNLRESVVKLTQAVTRTRNDRDKWELRFDEMEIRWRESKRRREELRLEKLELEAMLSDALSKIQ